MFIVDSDTIFDEDKQGTKPDYNWRNPLLKLLNLLERAQLAAEREFYLSDHLQYLFPYDHLVFYAPADKSSDPDPRKQDKSDWKKQNLRDFRSTDTFLMRGLVTVGDWTGPFIKLSYRGGPDSQLSVATNHKLGEHIKLWIKVGDVGTPSLITVPYNRVSNRYEVEIWGYPEKDLRERLYDKGRNAFDRGVLIVNNSLVYGSVSDFNRDSLKDHEDLSKVAPNNTMHPVLPLHIELAWANFREKIWDSLEKAKYHYEFNMILRGWDNFLQTGTTPGEYLHGGIGFQEYRTLLSNYDKHKSKKELGRQLNTWNFNAYGTKSHNNEFEKFFAVNYMDLNILKPNSGVGLHRHRDNQEIFLMMEGQGFMVIGDWCKMPNRERCFEIRTLRSGHFAMLKGGNLHALMNSTDKDAFFYSFGSYD